MSNLTKLAPTSIVCVWPMADLTSAGSHGMLQLDVRRVSVQFWSGCFSSPEWFGAVVFKHLFTLPTLIVSYSPFLTTDLISVDGCLE